MAGPVYFNQETINLLKAAGLDPSVILGKKMPKEAIDPTLEIEVKKFLRVKDEQDAVNRFKWYNLPCDLTSQELERMLYYKGQLCFFYIEQLNKFYFMPYALDGTIDFYGRYNTIHPVPMTSGSDDEKEKKSSKEQEAYLSTIKLNCVYGVKSKVELEDLTKSTVLLHDYTKQRSQQIIPRQQVNDKIVEIESEFIPLMRTNLINGTGVHAMRVPDGDSASSAKLASESVVAAAKKGQIFIPVLGEAGDWQDLPNSASSQANEYMMAMQSIDNFRLSGYGITNGGLFEKQAHRNDSENMINQSSVEAPMQDGLTIRQNFCHIVNSIWGLGIWCDISENITQVDANLDGVTYDSDIQATQAPTENEVESNE